MKKNKFLLTPIAICLILVAFTLSACSKSKDDSETVVEELETTTEFTTIVPDFDRDNTLNKPFIIPDIQEQYPDKKVLVWLMDEYALSNMTEAWLTAFNDKLIEKGADFVLQMQRVSSFYEYYDEIKSHIKDGDQVDILYTGGTLDLGKAGGMSDSYMYAYQNDLLMPLDDYFNSEAGQALYEVFDEKCWKSVSINGEIYGFNISPHIGMVSTVLATNEVIDKYNLDSDGVTNDLTSLLPMVASMSDEEYPVEFNDNLQEIMMFLGYEFIELPIALDAERGAFNFFEDSKCTDYLESVRSFYELGYLDPNTQGERWSASITLPLDGIPDLFDSFIDYVYWPVTTLKVETEKSAVGISKTSQYPEECIQLFSWLYTDRELADLLLYGVEGVNYSLDNGLVVPAGENTLNPFLKWNTGLILFTTPSSTDIDNKYESYAEYNATAKMSSLVGFHFNSLGLEDKILELNTIVEKYTVLIEEDKNYAGNDVEVYRTFLTGYDQNLDETLNALNAELKTAGIDELIDEVNRQYDEWKQYSPVNE